MKLYELQIGARFKKSTASDYYARKISLSGERLTKVVVWYIPTMHNAGIWIYPSDSDVELYNGPYAPDDKEKS